ncbi:hypothetical protein JDS87_33630, partial [Bacillus cereus]|nr:hypothetical protein [Bacillus cereus]
TFCLMVLVLLTDWLLFSRQSKRLPHIIQPAEAHSNPHRIKRKTIQLAFMLLSFMTVVSLVDAWIGKGYLFAVVLTIIPFALL